MPDEPPILDYQPPPEPREVLPPGIRLTCGVLSVALALFTLLILSAGLFNPAEWVGLSAAATVTGALTYMFWTLYGVPLFPGRR